MILFITSSLLIKHVKGLDPDFRNISYRSAFPLKKKKTIAESFVKQVKKNRKLSLRE